MPVTNLLAFIVAITAHVQNKIVIDPPPRHHAASVRTPLARMLPRVMSESDEEVFACG